ncbi:hypothetical protein ACFQ1M_11070 [Sungkyunkwania multivorans]|uniref:Lipoprotein n=1 Tax=Sungkyunkwania multivorans TaxID=1173618 RepID=A0ABW3CY74_9FLAO
MRKWYYILSLMLLWSCANNTSKEMAPAIEAEADLVEGSIMTTEDAYLQLAKQRIQDQLDRARLEAQHPDFSVKLKERIFTETLSADASLEELQIISQETVADTTFLVLKAVFKDATIRTTDTLNAKIISKTVALDGEVFRTSSIVFE